MRQKSYIEQKSLRWLYKHIIKPFEYIYLERIGIWHKEVQYRDFWIFYTGNISTKVSLQVCRASLTVTLMVKIFFSFKMSDISV